MNRRLTDDELARLRAQVADRRASVFRDVLNRGGFRNVLKALLQEVAETRAVADRILERELDRLAPSKCSVCGLYQPRCGCA